LAANEDAESYHIAQFIRDVMNGKKQLALAPDGRRPSYADFAILMRSTSHQIRLERMLRRHAIPYVADAARSLFLDAPVNDMYQMLQLIVYPTDRVAYAALLRSPFVGLSDDALIRVLSRNAEPFGDVDLEPGTLSTFAEVGIALAGFSGVVVVLGRRAVGEWIPLDRFRAITLLTLSLLLVVFSLLPLVLEPLGLAELTSLRLCNGLFAVGHASIICSASRGRASCGPSARNSAWEYELSS